MCSESSFRLHSSSGQKGGQSDGGVSSRTPRSDGADGPSMQSISGHDDLGTHEDFLLGFSSHREHSYKGQWFGASAASLAPCGRKGVFLRALKIIKSFFCSLQVSSFGLQMILFTPSLGPG